MRSTLVMLVSCCALSSALAEQAGQIRFAVPPGWSLKTVQGVAQLTPQDLPLGQTATLTVGMGAPFSGDFAAWFDKATDGVLPGYTLVNRSSPIKAQAEGGVPLLGRSVTLKSKDGNTLYLLYVGANPRGRVELMFFTASSLETFRKYQPGLNAVTASVKFVGESTSAQATSGQGRDSAPAVASSGSLPALATPKLTQLLAGGFDPAKQPIPDEFRCYPEMRSDAWQQPAFALQILPGGQYRVPGGGGKYSAKAGSSGLRKIKFDTGPLAGSDEAYLLWNRQSGQTIEVQNYPLGEDRSVDIPCYQRGAREAVARDLFRRKDPQIGKYPCRSTDGKNTDMGTLELLSGRKYRYKGGEGSYSVPILNDQDTDYTGPWLDFRSGPLEDVSINYFEKTSGERSLDFLRNGLCTVVVKPQPLPKFGPDKAPAPPRGYGGLEGNFFITRQQFYPSMAGGGSFKFVPYFYFFDKNGYVYTDDPEEGIGDSDCSRTHPSGLPVCELYRLEGGKISIGDDKPKPYTLKGGVLTLDGDALTRITAVDGLKLEGAYKNTSSFTAVVGSGGGLWVDYITFKKDGSFKREKSGGISITTTTDGSALGDPTAFVGSSSEKRNSGRYSFSGNTLTLSYGDGSVERKFAFLPAQEKGKADLEWLQLSGSDYFYQDPKKKN